MKTLKKLVRRAVKRRAPRRPQYDLLHDLSAADQATFARVRPYTMTSPARIAALLDAVDYVARRRIPGALVECGVWRGGSVMAMLLKLIEHGDTDRDIFLFDTFEGMTAPTADDVSLSGQSALSVWNSAVSAGRKAWDNMFGAEVFGIDSVRAALATTGYPDARLHFVQGTVETTIPEAAPETIALLRLDTDWYTSTRHEMEHLYPRLSPGGILLIDDYGHWQGSRKAVDEFLAQPDETPVLLQRIDYSGRLAIKP